MKKNVRVIIATVAALFAVTTMFTGCNPKKAWKTDYEAAKETATKQKKNIFIFFSGDDWDEKSEAFKKNVTETKEFVNAMKKQYVLVNLDFSQKEYSATDIDQTTASEEDKKKADDIKAKYDTNSAIASKFNVNSYPAMYITSAQGYVIASIPFDEKITKPADYVAQIAKSKETIDKFNTLLSAVDAAKGIDRVKAIDNLYEASDENFRSPLEPLMREIPTLDTENTTGLVGKYEMQIAYADAVAKAREKDAAGAAQVFVDACTNGHLDPSQKQEAYYTAAYVLATSGGDEYDKMIDLLNKAYECDPTNEHASEITQTIQAVKQMKVSAASQATKGAETTVPEK